MSDELTPIVFIPGLMGSIGGEMLGCKSDWGFGVASWFYKPFIKQLENLGYRLNKNLFVCYYDWRKSCTYTVEQFLLPLLVQIKERCANQKIDLLCYSMGGLVGRTYIQGKIYKYDIRNLIIFGTPNKGNVEAYYVWSMGKLMNRPGKINPLFKIIKSGYIWLLSKILNIPLGKNNIEKLHKNFEGLKDLLPTYDYGYILCYGNENNSYTYIPNKYIKYKNNFINNLNRNINILYNRIENLYCFVGTNKETDKTLVIDKELFFEDKVEKIIDSLTTKKGDGTVTTKSATINYGKTFIIEEGHLGVLTNSIQYIAEIYNLDKSLIKKDIKVAENPLGIIFKRDVNIKLKNDYSVVAKFINKKIITKYEFIVEEFGKDFTWIIFKNIPSGQYVLEVFTKYSESYNIFVVGAKVKEELTYYNVQKMGKEKIGFYFVI